MFHVKHSLTDAKAPEQRIEHILRRRAAGEPIKGPSRVAKVLRDDQRVERFTVTVTNLESIHAHNAVATIRGRK